MKKMGEIAPIFHISFGVLLLFVFTHDFLISDHSS